MRAQNPREIAWRVLQRRGDRDYVEDLLETGLADAALSPRDRALCQEMAYGAVRWQGTLDWLIARKTTGRTQKTGLQNLLRLGLYQMFWLDRVPDHAVVNETVELAKRNGFGPQAGFVNAALRGYLRERDETERLLVQLKSTQPHLGYSHPEWLWRRSQERWGEEKAAALMEWNNSSPKNFARVNTLKTDAGKLLARWRDEGVEYDFIRRDWTGENLVFELKSHPPLERLASFREGWFYIQDPSTLLAVHVLSPQPGETILDSCAAPGGKTTFAAQMMENNGHIAACDVSAERLKLIQENCQRLGVTCVEERLLENERESASTPPAERKFDRILVDAPCSNTGVMRRRVELRWRIQPTEIERLRTVQLDLLRRAARQLKPGGTLVYSTCSLEPEENSDAIRQFLAETPGFQLDHEQELLPFADAVDGAYVARLTRA